MYVFIYRAIVLRKPGTRDRFIRGFSVRRDYQIRNADSVRSYFSIFNRRHFLTYKVHSITVAIDKPRLHAYDSRAEI